VPYAKRRGGIDRWLSNELGLLPLVRDLLAD